MTVYCKNWIICAVCRYWNSSCCGRPAVVQMYSSLFFVNERRNNQELPGDCEYNWNNEVFNNKTTKNDTYSFKWTMTWVLEVHRPCFCAFIPLFIVWNIMKALSSLWNPFTSRSIWFNVICLSHIKLPRTVLIIALAVLISIDCQRGPLWNTEVVQQPAA